METLKKGSKGDTVKTLQKCLGLNADGVFGQLTENAVKTFQNANKLVSDGIVGNKTWELLLNQKNENKNTEYIVKGLKLKKTSKRQIKGIILHCSATQEGKDYDIDIIRKWHKQRGFNDIGYHYVIYRDGSIHVGRDIDIAGAHTSGYNSKTIGICYIGGVDKNNKVKDTRTDAQKSSLVALVNMLMNMYGLNKSTVHCHYEYANKACPSFKIEPFRASL